MGRFKRRVLIGGVLFVLALAGVGAWGYYHFFVATGAALRRAETLSFRRMTVAQLAEPGSYRFYYATNRMRIAEDGSFVDGFGNERGSTVGFGRFDTAIQQRVGLGMFLDPTDWFQNEEIRLRDVRSLDDAAFVAQLRERVERTPDRSLLVIVHGYREAFESALRKTAFVGHVLDINTPILLFDWPGNQGSSLRGYRRAQQIASASGAELAATLAVVVREVRPDRLWLVANSMGGEVVVRAFGLLFADADFADAETEIEDVVLTAPDVDHDEFDSQFKQEVSALAKHLTVYVSANDRALLLSRIVNRGRRRGESTIDTMSPDQIEEAARVADLVEPDNDRIALVDVTPVNRTRNFHNFSLETPEFFDDLYLRLTNEATPHNRLIYPLRTPEGTVYWVLTSGR
ncbi:MAG: alpha/beta fold hydrolase [Rhodospirillales bacterium]|nr:MAG: alpha/beta fold hydrolase [Rhodospirillales bacterium]